jgi:DNA-binding beta-propeller fold protein YncE
LLRFTPDPQNVSLALANGDWTNFLKLPAGPGAKWQYLVLNYTSGTKSGTYSWTSNITQGWASAYAHFQNIEGIDIFNGMLYMTAKWNQQLFILDLDKRTFVESSTASGAFADQPDQIARLVDDDGILYFCEDADSGSGVHGRNSAGQYFTILQADTNYATNGGVVMLGETSGLAFSPDRMFMYVSYQYKGKIIEVRRADGLPFNGRRLDIKYHSV